jgi:putative lipoprotein
MAKFGWLALAWFAFVPRAEAIGQALAVVRGTVLLEREPAQFVRCGSGSRHVLEDRTAGALRAAHHRVMKGRGGEMFVELSATVEPGADGASRVVARALRRAQREGRGCAEDLTHVIVSASGNEPFWRVDVGKDGAALRTPGRAHALDLHRVALRTAGGRRVITAWKKGAAAPALRLEIEPGRCVDSMSGAWYAWRAQAGFDGRRHEGCALEGDLPP